MNEINEVKRNFGRSFGIYRAVIGKQGCGKTPFIANEILPRIPNHNYFIFNRSHDKAYDNVLPSKIYRGEHATGYLVATETYRKDIELIIHENQPSSTVFIFEDAGSILGKNWEWFRRLQLEYRFQFILCFQMVNSKILKKLDQFIDLYYLVDQPIAKPPRAFDIDNNPKVLWVPTVTIRKQKKKVL